MASDQDQRVGGKRARVELDVDLGTYGRYFLTKMANVSTGGAFILTESLHPVGTPLNIRFRLPDDDASIEATAEVIWTYKQPGGSSPNASGMGVRFMEIRPEDEERISDFVARSTQP